MGSNCRFFFKLDVDVWKNRSTLALHNVLFIPMQCLRNYEIQ